MDETLARIRQELTEAREGHLRAVAQHRAEAVEALERGSYTSAATACHRAHQQNLCAIALERWTQ